MSKRNAKRKAEYEMLKYMSGGSVKGKPKYISNFEWVDKIGPERWHKWFDGLSDSQRAFIRKHGTVYATYNVWKGLKDNKGWKWDLYVD
jgi:hypothetical protein